MDNGLIVDLGYFEHYKRNGKLGKNIRWYIQLIIQRFF